MRRSSNLFRFPGVPQQEPSKQAWCGVIVSVQPRIRLLRSFDQSEHQYLGYALGLDGSVSGERREFSVGIGKVAQAKQAFRLGDEVGGQATVVADERLEPVEFYKVSKLKLERRGEPAPTSPPPWHGTPPELPVYRERGHRRLSARTYNSKCRSCIWACRMPVEMIIDQWSPSVRKYRRETFCYGPLSCKLYKAGPNRVVPGRKGMTWVEEDWVDEQNVSHRGPEE